MPLLSTTGIAERWKGATYCQSERRGCA